MTDPEIHANNPKPKAGLLLKLLAVVLTLLSAFLAMSTALRRGVTLEGEIIGSAVGPLVLGLIVVALFQLFKRFRHSRSRWKIYCWTLFITGVSNLLHAIQEIVEAAS